MRKVKELERDAIEPERIAPDTHRVHQTRFRSKIVLVLFLRLC